MVFLDLCRSIADSPLELSIVTAGLIGVFAINNLFIAAPLSAFEDGLNVPDVRITGYTPDELNQWYDNIGVEGCKIYIQCTHFDFFPIMVTYPIVLGSMIILVARKSGLSEQFALIPLATVTCDMVETFIQRRGCVIFPERLGTQTIQRGSIACQMKWVLLLASIFMILQIAVVQGVKALGPPSNALAKRKRD